MAAVQLGYLSNVSTWVWAHKSRLLNSCLPLFTAWRFCQMAEKKPQRQGEIHPNPHLQQYNQMLMQVSMQRFSVQLATARSAEESEPFAGACCALPAEHAENKAFGFLRSCAKKPIKFGFLRPHCNLPPIQSLLV